MIEVFNQEVFSAYRIEDTRFLGVLNESKHFSAGARRTSKKAVFISFKHSDLEDLKGLIGYLERTYHVECYIDAKDPGLPDKTSGKTAKRIKKAIGETDYFILLATDNAVALKWCNWELGYGDAQKYRDRIAILPMKNSNRTLYSGNEYMQIYPRIVKVVSSDITTIKRLYYSDFPTTPGYFVMSVDSAGKETYVSLNFWLHR